MKLDQPDWSPLSQILAMIVQLNNERLLLHIILNAYWEAFDFEFPIVRNGQENWRRWIDTRLDFPHEFSQWNEAAPVPGGTYRAGARLVAVLIAGEAVMGGHFR